MICLGLNFQLNDDFSGGHGKYKGNIEKFSIPDESYANSILSSMVSMTLEDAGLGFELLTAEKLIELRQKSIINCNQDENPMTDCNASGDTPCLYHIINDPCESQIL